MKRTLLLLQRIVPVVVVLALVPGAWAGVAAAEGYVAVGLQIVCDLRPIVLGHWYFSERLSVTGRIHADDRSREPVTSAMLRVRTSVSGDVLGLATGFLVGASAPVEDPETPRYQAGVFADLGLMFLTGEVFLELQAEALRGVARLRNVFPLRAIGRHYSVIGGEASLTLGNPPSRPPLNLLVFAGLAF